MDDDKIPHRSYDLIKMLDQTTPIPEVPSTIAQVALFDAAAQRRAIFAAGFRHMADMLVSQMNEEIRGDDEDDEPDGVPDGSRAGLGRVFGSDGDVRETSVGGWLDRDTPE